MDASDALPRGCAALVGVCSAVGADFHQVSPAVRARMQLLADHTETIQDCTRIAALANEVFHYYDRHKPTERFSDAEKRIVVIGSLFADIGKTGPAHADAEQQQLIVEMFSVEGVRDDQQTVAQFFRTYFAQDAMQRIARFTALGLNPSMTMRAFWNLHSTWTLDVVRGGGVPDEAVAAAASHHLLENINPHAIVAEDGRFAVEFGDNESFDRAEKLVILLDKYDAVIRRGRRTHAQAIAWLRQLLDTHAGFATDPEFSKLLADLDATVRARSGT